jgi:hypothetical protein
VIGSRLMDVAAVPMLCCTVLILFVDVNCDELKCSF